MILLPKRLLNVVRRIHQKLYNPQTQKREWLQLPLILLDVWMDKPEQEIHLPGPTHEDP